MSVADRLKTYDSFCTWHSQTRLTVNLALYLLLSHLAATAVYISLYHLCGDKGRPYRYHCS